MTEQETDLITLTADIVGAHVAHNNVPTGDIAALIQSVHTALKSLGQAPEPVVEKQEPAVSIRSSVKPAPLSGKWMRVTMRLSDGSPLETGISRQIARLRSGAKLRLAMVRSIATLIRSLLSAHSE